MKKSAIGKFGEDLSCMFLSGKHYKILERNYRKPWGEIDVISLSPSGVLVFVEVKTIRQGDILPEEHLTISKLHKLQITSSLLANGDYSRFSKKGWQIDLIAIVLQNPKEVFRISHYENIA